MMESEKNDKRRFRLVDWLTAGVIGAAALGVYFALFADYAYPGESATLVSSLSGLETLPAAKYPVMMWLVRLLGAGSWIPPVFGALSAFFVFTIVTSFLRDRLGGDFSPESVASVSRLGGAAAALVFAFNPSVISSATHLDACLIDAAWTLAALALLPLSARAPKSVAWAVPLAVGAMAGAGAADTAAAVTMSPVFLLAVWSWSVSRKGKGYIAASFFVAAFLTAFIWVVVSGCGGFSGYYNVQKALVRLWRHTDGTFAVLIFSMLPFAVALFSARKAFSGEPEKIDNIFHGLMTLFSAIALASPFSPSSVLGRAQHHPVLTVAMVALVVGYLLAYWRSLSVTSRVANESVENSAKEAKSHRTFGVALLGSYAVFLVLSVPVAAITGFDSGAGKFADAVADRVVADLGDRAWFVTDGTLDSHLRLAAKRAGRELNLVCLQRDGDKKYIEELAETLKAKGLGAYVERLDRYGILRFLQDWLSTDRNVAAKLAVWGAPDLWHYAPGLRPVPEFLFYGADPSRTLIDLEGRAKFADEVLPAEEGWGSFRLHEEKSDLDRRRLNLRRHLGFVTCNVGSSEHAEARKLDNAGLKDDAAKRYDSAFDCYELVLRKLDADNVSALFNELELLVRENRKANSKKKEILSALEAMRADETRRYDLGRLGLVYGYLQNPGIIVRQGLGEIRHGSYEQGVSQIRRAMDLVSVEQSDWTQLNILAPLYASGGASNRTKAEKIYTSELERNPSNRVALVGLARLAMLNGDNDSAIRLLEQATAGAEGDPGSYVDIATLRMMRGELAVAKDLLLKATDSAPNNMKAWSLLAAVDMQMLDALASVEDEAAREVRRKELEDELNKIVVARMEKINPDDPQVASVKAFIKMRKGGEENLRSARDELKRVADASGTEGGMGDIVLGLDIRLNDKDDAEERALGRLRDDPENPLANYVVGSVALGRGELDTAEKHLRVAVGGKNPNLMALNDLAEVLRMKKNYADAEKYARAATVAAPQLYVVWETLGSILLDAGDDAHVFEAESCIVKACEMSKEANGDPADPRMLISLARVQVRLGKDTDARRTLRALKKFSKGLEEADKKKLMEVMKLVNVK